MRCLVLALMSFLLIGASSQEKPAPKKDRKSDEQPSTFQPYNVTGKFKGRFHCLVCQYGLNPVAAVFVRGTDNLEGVAALLQKLDEAVKKNEKARLASFAVFVDDKLTDVVGDNDEREALASKLEEVSGKLERVVVALESKGNLEKYRLDPEAEVTLVLYNRLKIVEVRPVTKAQLSKEGIPNLVNEIVAKLTAKK
jgi:hypothetical protein